LVARGSISYERYPLSTPVSEHHWNTQLRGIFYRTEINRNLQLTTHLNLYLVHDIYAVKTNLDQIVTEYWHPVSRQKFKFLPPRLAPFLAICGAVTVSETSSANGSVADMAIFHNVIMKA
jgi:hypothetical protein